MKIDRKSRKEFRVTVPHRDEKDEPTVRDMYKWCQATFGEDGRNRKCQWRYGWLKDFDSPLTYYFYFRKEKDALFFAMKWA